MTAPRGQLLNFYGYLERNNRLEFEIVALHSANDVIHPYAFKLYSTLLRKYPAVQLPVLALPLAGNFWQRLLNAGYASDFSEEQLRYLPIREALGFFPSSISIQRPPTSTPPCGCGESGKPCMFTCNPSFAWTTTAKHGARSSRSGKPPTLAVLQARAKDTGRLPWAHNCSRPC